MDICMHLFAGELTNQNREYYKVNDNRIYLHAIDQSQCIKQLQL